MYMYMYNYVLYNDYVIVDILHIVHNYNNYNYVRVSLL